MYVSVEHETITTTTTTTIATNISTRMQSFLAVEHKIFSLAAFHATRDGHSRDETHSSFG